MKLIEAKIINFGKFHNQTINFTDNLNTIIHENGWGKTTLTVFIKAMLYGMEASTVKDLNKNERAKYTPWQGGSYGGSLTFSHNGKEYRVSRNFDSKKDDNFELIDLATNEISKDFSSDLGNEIFGINKDTYARSVHVTLDSAPENTTDISAKLNNLVEAGDVTSFDDACKILNSRATEIKAKRGSSGRLYVIQDEIDNDKQKLEEIKSLITQNETLQSSIDEAKKTADTIQTKQDEINAQIANSIKYEVKSRYEQLQSDAENAGEKKSATEKFFNGKIPSDEMISNIDVICQEFTTVVSNIKNQSATQSEKDDYKILCEYFGGDEPSKEQIEVCLKTDQEYKSFKQNSSAKKLSDAEQKEFESLNSKYQGAQISESIISEYMANLDAVQKNKQQLSFLTNDLSNKENRYQLEQQTKVRNTKRIIFLTIGIVLIAAGVAGFIMKLLPIGIAGIAVGAILSVLGILSKAKTVDSSELASEIEEAKKTISDLDSRTQQMENQYRLFISKYAPQSPSEIVALSTINSEYSNYQRLEKKNQDFTTWMATQKNPEEYENSLRAFMKRYCKTDDISSVPTEIQNLNGKLEKLGSLKKRVNSDSENSSKYNELKEKLDSILSDFNTDRTKDYSEQIQQLHEEIVNLRNCDSAISEAKKKLDDFEKENAADIASLGTVTKPEKTADELNDEMTQITSELNQINKTISDCQKRIDDNLSDIDKKDDIENEIENLTAEKKEKTKEHSLLLTTLELLEQAKEKLDRNYSGSMIDGFNKYISLLGTDVNLAIDKDLKVSVDAEGKFRASDYLSAGYKDMVNVCSRMALIDALFKDSNPPVILDDPFVNLDDAKMKNALKLVDQMSKERQIIYFACHKSRDVK